MAAILERMSDAPLPLDGFYAVIPAGGVGSRLWPLSRADAPKFLHDLTGSGQTLLKDTWDRLAPIAGEQRIMIVTGRAHRAAVERQLPDLADANIVLESEPRDSTAAIGLAAAVLERREPGVVIGSFAADHVISGEALFRSAVVDAVAAARAGYIVTIGITPTEPAVGFGYIECGGPVAVPGAKLVEKVADFVEKPDLESARRYVEGGRHLWNARSPTCMRASSSSPRRGTTRPPADLRSTASGRSSRRSPSTTRSRSPPQRRGGSPSSAATSSGTTWATSHPSPSSTRRAGRASSRSSASTPASSPTRRAASW